VRKNIRMGELLVDAGLINTSEFQEPCKRQNVCNQPLGRILFDSGLLRAQDLRNAVKVQLMCRAAALRQNMPHP